MYLIYGLWILSFLNKPLLMICFIIILAAKLYVESYQKKLYLWLLCSILFLFMHQHNFKDISRYYRVSDVKEYKIHLRNGLNTYEVSGKHNYELDDVVKVNQIYEHTFLSQYQKTNRIKGYASLDDIELVRRPFSIRRTFYHSLTKPLQIFYSRYEISIFSVISIQLMGLLKIVEIISRRFLIDEHYTYVEYFIILLYGYLFGFTFGVVRILLKTIFHTKEKYLVFLLILYPYSFYDAGFNLVFLPTLLQNLSPSFKDVNFHIIRSFLMLRLFGRIHILEMLLYPIIKIYSGFICLMTLIQMHTVSEFLIAMGQKMLHNRFLIVGFPSLIWFSFFLFQNKKKQMMTFLFMCLFYTYYPFIQVTMINVYQGDATLITFPFNSMSVLIDTGRASAYKTLKQSLYKLGVSELDYLVITHDDLDHCENKDVLIEDFKVTHLVEHKTQTVPYMTHMLKDRIYGDENEDSLILYFNTSKASFLFMGDASITQEKDILKDHPFLSVDVLKLGHHGSKTSTSEKFIEGLKPKLALISSDPRMYGHPHPEVMQNLRKFRVPSVQSSIEGDVKIILLPFFNIVVSEAGGFGIIR